MSAKRHPRYDVRMHAAARPSGGARQARRVDPQPIQAIRDIQPASDVSCPDASFLRALA